MTKETLKSVIYSAKGIPTISDSGFGSHPLCYIISLKDWKMLEKKSLHMGTGGKLMKTLYPVPGGNK